MSLNLCLHSSPSLQAEARLQQQEMPPLRDRVPETDGELVPRLKRLGVCMRELWKTELSLN